MIGIGDKVTAEIRRGPESWTFIYVALGRQSASKRLRRASKGFGYVWQQRAC